MKKLLNLTMLFAALTLGLFSCENKPADPSNDPVTPPPPPENKVVEELDLNNAYFYKSYNSNDCSFFTKGSVANGEIVNHEAMYYSFSILLDNPGATLPNGTYTEDDLDMKYSWLANVDDVASQNQNAYLSIEKATITVESGKFNAVINASNGETYDITYTGELTFKDGDAEMEAQAFELEETTPTTINMTATKCTAGYGDYADLGVRALSVTLEDDTKTANLYVFFPVGSDSYYGTYTFKKMANGYETGAVWASDGFDGMYLNGAYLATKGEQEGYVDLPIYFLVSGSMTIAVNKVTVNSQSYFGSTVTITYNGAFEPQAFEM